MDRDLVKIATEFKEKVDELSKLYKVYNKADWSEKNDIYSDIRPVEYEVSTLYKKVSAEMSRIWNDSKNA